MHIYIYIYFNTAKETSCILTFKMSSKNCAILRAICKLQTTPTMNRFGEGIVPSHWYKSICPIAGMPQTIEKTQPVIDIVSIFDVRGKLKRKFCAAVWSRRADYSVQRGNEDLFNVGACITLLDPHRVNSMFILERASPECVFWQSCMHDHKQVALIKGYEDEIWEVIFLVPMNCREESEETPMEIFKTNWHQLPSKNLHLALPVQHLSWDTTKTTQCRRVVVLSWFGASIEQWSKPSWHSIILIGSLGIFIMSYEIIPYISLGSYFSPPI